MKKPTRYYLWHSDCCRATLASYKETECPECGEPCHAEAADIDAPDDYIPEPPLHRGRKDAEQ